MANKCCLNEENDVEVIVIEDEDDNEEMDTQFGGNETADVKGVLHIFAGRRNVNFVEFKRLYGTWPFEEGRSGFDEKCQSSKV